MTSDPQNLPTFGKLKKLGESDKSSKPEVSEEHLIPDEKNDYQEDDFQIVENVPAPPKILSGVPKGVSIASKATVPTTTSFPIS